MRVRQVPRAINREVTWRGIFVIQPQLPRKSRNREVTGTSVSQQGPRAFHPPGGHAKVPVGVGRHVFRAQAISGAVVAAADRVAVPDDQELRMRHGAIPPLIRRLIRVQYFTDPAFVCRNVECICPHRGQCRERRCEQNREAATANHAGSGRFQRGFSDPILRRTRAPLPNPAAAARAPCRIPRAEWRDTESTVSSGLP